MNFQRSKDYYCIIFTFSCYLLGVISLFIAFFGYLDLYLGGVDKYLLIFKTLSVNIYEIIYPKKGPKVLIPFIITSFVRTVNLNRILSC